MGNTKIRIDLSQGVIEAEGEEKFVRSIYDDFKERLNTRKVAHKGAKGGKKKDSKRKKEVSEGVIQQKRRRTAEAYSPKLVTDLDLSGGKKGENLRKFYAKYNAKTNMERNLVFVYYLQHSLELKSINCDHIFTCYRDITKLKVPTALYQSLIDTSKNKGWLNTKSMDNIKVTIKGINYIEHDMPKVGVAKNE